MKVLARHCSLFQKQMTERIEGKLPFINNVELHIPVEFGDGKPALIRLDTGASYSQISSNFAEYLGLKSHPKLIGSSILGNGSLKFDYLAMTPITLNGICSSLVVKIGPDQPHRLGLDAMVRFDLTIDPVRATFTQGASPINDQDHPFNFINLEAYMAKLGIKDEDLIPIQDLPNPKMAYKSLLEAGTASNVIDLGTSYLPCVSSDFTGLYLGRQ